MAQTPSYMLKEVTMIEVHPSGRIYHYVNIVPLHRVYEHIVHWPMRIGCFYCCDVFNVE